MPTTPETPTVVFLCIHNAGRSQMALGWLDHLAAGRVTGYSAGSEPADQLNPTAVAAMAEVGIDISTEQPKVWTTDMLDQADVVVTISWDRTTARMAVSGLRGWCRTWADQSGPAGGRYGMGDQRWSVPRLGATVGATGICVPKLARAKIGGSRRTAPQVVAPSRTATIYGVQ